MFELLVFGTVGFWIAASIATIFILISLEGDYGGSGATITMIFFGVLYFFFGGREVFGSLWDTFMNHPVTLFTYSIVYTAIGLSWSFAKWYFYLLNAKEKLKGKSTIYAYDIPKTSSHKGDIIAWMTYWPFSSLWTLINDPVKRFFKFMYSRFENLYQKMSDKMFTDIKLED